MSYKWYQFHDGIFRFVTAHYGSWAHNKRIVFRVRIDTTPVKRAKEKGIEFFDRIIPSTNLEIAYWVYGHPTFHSTLIKENDPHFQFIKNKGK